jgi:hypothetical protein
MNKTWAKRIIITSSILFGFSMLTEIIWALPVRVVVLWPIEHALVKLNLPQGVSLLKFRVFLMIALKAAFYTYPLIYLIGLRCSVNVYRRHRFTRAVYYALMPLLNFITIFIVLLIAYSVATVPNPYQRLAQNVDKMSWLWFWFYAQF